MCNQLNLYVQYIASILRYLCSNVRSCVVVDVHCVDRLRIVRAVDTSAVLVLLCSACSAGITKELAHAYKLIFREIKSYFYF